MTPMQARLGAIVALVLGVLGVYLSRRPTTDIAAGLLAGCAFLYFAASSLSSNRRDRQARRDRERAREQDAAAEWKRYSHPIGHDYRDYEVGCEIELDGVCKRYVVRRWRNEHPGLDDRTRAELEADVKVNEFNATHWRP